MPLNCLPDVKIAQQDVAIKHLLRSAYLRGHFVHHEGPHVAAVSHQISEGLEQPLERPQCFFQNKSIRDDAAIAVTIRD